MQNFFLDSAFWKGDRPETILIEVNGQLSNLLQNKLENMSPHNMKFAFKLKFEVKLPVLCRFDR